MKQKYIWKSDKKTKAQNFVLNKFNEGKSYNPMKHYKWHQIKNDIKKLLFKNKLKSCGLMASTKVLINNRCCYRSKSTPLQNKWDFYFRTVAQRKCFLIRWNLESIVLQRTLEEHVLGWISALIAIISRLNHWTFILHLFCFIITCVE